MNQTELNSELLSADARGRKHIPFAVFAVILIHIVLFVVLLIAAGCRSAARAKANTPAEPQGTHPAEKYLQAANQPAAVAPLSSTTEQVMATEPEIAEASQTQARAELAEADEPAPSAALAQFTKAARNATAHPIVQKTSPKPRATRQHAVYIVQSGDTIGEIAKRHGTSIEAIKIANKLKGHLIYPGQKLVVRPTAGSTAQARKAKSSNEV